MNCSYNAINLQNIGVMPQRNYVLKRSFDYFFVNSLLIPKFTWDEVSKVPCTMGSDTQKENTNSRRAMRNTLALLPL